MAESNGKTAEISLKDQGNEFFEAGNYLKAAALYTQAIKHDPSDPTLYSNRAAAFLHLVQLNKALTDAETTISLKPDWEKGYFKKGCVLEAMERYEDALAALQVALKYNSQSSEVFKKIKRLTQLARDKKRAQEVEASRSNVDTTKHLDSLKTELAFESPHTRKNCFSFLRQYAEDSSSQAACLVAPKSIISYPQMARRSRTPMKRTSRVLTFEEHIERFRTYARDPKDSIGEFIGHFTALWRRVSGADRGVCDIEASFRLLRALPPRWTRWATHEMGETVTYHPVTFVEIGNFPRFVCKIMMQWMTTGGPPPTETPTLSPSSWLRVSPPEWEISLDYSPPATPTPVLPRRRGRNDFEAGPSWVRYINDVQQTPPSPPLIEMTDDTSATFQLSKRVVAHIVDSQDDTDYSE